MCVSEVGGWPELGGCFEGKMGEGESRCLLNASLCWDHIMFPPQYF